MLPASSMTTVSAVRLDPAQSARTSASLTCTAPKSASCWLAITAATPAASASVAGLAVYPSGNTLVTCAVCHQRLHRSCMWDCLLGTEAGSRARRCRAGVAQRCGQVIASSEPHTQSSNEGIACAGGVDGLDLIGSLGPCSVAGVPYGPHGSATLGPHRSLHPQGDHDGGYRAGQQGCCCRGRNSRGRLGLADQQKARQQGRCLNLVDDQYVDVGQVLGRQRCGGRRVEH